MEYIIKNEYLEACIDSKGAELRKLIDTKGLNRMHIPSTKTWSGVSPLLFPLVSKLKDQLYKVDGKDYFMPMHGFCRNREFEVNKISNTSISFITRQDLDTLSIYPYNFTLEIIYLLNKDKLEVSMIVINNSNSIMYYMIGGHPGFELYESENEKFEDYYLKFEKKETSNTLLLADGYISNNQALYLDNSDILNLERDVFLKLDTIMLNNIKSSYVDILSTKSDKDIRLYFENFDVFAIWTKPIKEATYICLEPWCIQKEFVVDNHLMKIRELNPNCSDIHKYSIQIVK